MLVTGGAGFIGSHIVDALLGRGHKVTVLDDLSSGSKENIKAHLANPDFRFILGDVCDERQVREALSSVEAVIHEAAIVSVPFSIRNPEGTYRVNLGGTMNLLRASSEHRVRRFLLASSCAVYGEQKKLPIAEDAPPRPLSPYASSKLAAEERCREFFEREGLETVCLRYFNVYGPRQTFGEYAGVMMKFIERLRADQPPIIYGDGEQTRDFIHVQDVVEATLLALERDSAAGEVINIGTGRGVSINELCDIFLKTAGKTHIKPLHEAQRAGEIRHSQADIEKAKRLLGFRPRVPLAEGVRRVWTGMGYGDPGSSDRS